MKFVPKLPNKPDETEIGNLNEGECFLHNNCILMLVESDPKVVDLETGQLYELDEDAIVVPVDCTVNWKRKQAKKKKK